MIYITKVFCAINTQSHYEVKSRTLWWTYQLSLLCIVSALAITNQKWTMQSSIQWSLAGFNVTAQVWFTPSPIRTQCTGQCLYLQFDMSVFYEYENITTTEEEEKTAYLPWSMWADIVHWQTTCKTDSTGSAAVQWWPKQSSQPRSTHLFRTQTPTYRARHCTIWDMVPHSREEVTDGCYVKKSVQFLHSAALTPPCSLPVRCQVKTQTEFIKLWIVNITTDFF